MKKGALTTSLPRSPSPFSHRPPCPLKKISIPDSSSSSYLLLCCAIHIKASAIMHGLLLTMLFHCTLSRASKALSTYSRGLYNKRFLPPLIIGFQPLLSQDPFIPRLPDSYYPSPPRFLKTLLPGSYPLSFQVPICCLLGSYPISFKVPDNSPPRFLSPLLPGS